MLVFRLLNTKLPDLEDLGLTDTYKDVCRLGQ
jgi:Tfp pilus assembly ATPase PilU